MGNSTVRFMVTENTAAEDRTGYIYINKTANRYDDVTKVRQVGTAGVFYPYWNATEQSKKTSGEFTYAVYVTDDGSTGWKIGLEYTSSNVKYGLSTTSSSDAKSKAKTGTASDFSVSLTGGSKYVYIYADFSARTGSDWFNIKLYGPGTSSTNVIDTVKMTWTSNVVQIPSWNASAQTQTSSGDFAYTVYITDTSNAGWNVKLTGVSSGVKYGMSQSSAAAAKSGASSGGKTVSGTGSTYLYVYADFSSYSSSSDYFYISLYGPGTSSTAAISSNVRMGWNKATVAQHRLKVVLDGATGTPGGGEPYLTGNYDQSYETDYGMCGNNLQSSGSTVYFYIDDSSELSA